MRCRAATSGRCCSIRAYAFGTSSTRGKRKSPERHYHCLSIAGIMALHRAGYRRSKEETMNEITPRELSTLISLNPQRERLAKSTVKARAAKLKADLEKCRPTTATKTTKSGAKP